MSGTDLSFHTPEAGWRFPEVGLAVGLGLGFAETVLLIHTLLENFGGGGVLGLYLPILLVYGFVGALVDLGVQGAWLARGLDAPDWVLGGVVVAVIAVLGLATGQVVFTLVVELVLIVIWATIVLRARWLGVLSLAWMLWPMTADPEQERPALEEVVGGGGDIALIVLDTFRWDHSSAYGYERPTTVHMASLAEKGLRFERAYAPAPWSLPSHASLFTGRMPTDHGAHNEHIRFDSQWPTLAERLGAAGYETAGFSANPFAGSGPGTARGFHRFTDYWRPFTLREAAFGWRIWNAIMAPDRDKGGRTIVEDVRGVLSNRDEQRPLFLFVNFMETHAPYQEVPIENRMAFTSESPRRLERAGEACHMAQFFDTPVSKRDAEICLDLLDGATQAVDARLGELLGLLGEDTLVVVTADHGDEVGEHGRYGHNTGLRETVLRVPMILAGPGVSTGEVEELPVSLLDVAPTLLAYAGLEPRGLPGRNLLRLDESQDVALIKAEQWRAEFTTKGWRLANPDRDYSAELARKGAVIGSQFKRVVTEDGRDLGFDLEADPDEKLPFPGEATQLQAWLPGPGG